MMCYRLYLCELVISVSFSSPRKDKKSLSLKGQITSRFLQYSTDTPFPTSL